MIIDKFQRGYYTVISTRNVRVLIINLLEVELLMYSRFKLNINENSLFQKYYDIGKESANQHKEILERDLDQYIDYHTGRIDGDRLEKEWFKEINADVFLSHSHADEELAISIAGWLKSEMGLNAFVDSCTWGYADTLLQYINDHYNVLRKDTDGSTIYSHSKANYAASHIYLMLNSAINNMINKTECFMFINTGNSIIQMDKNQSSTQTLSPWIYSEIVMANTIKQTFPKRPMKIEKNSRHYAELNESVEITHNLDFADFINLDRNAFIRWKGVSLVRDEHPLDVLYYITGTKEN